MTPRLQILGRILVMTGVLAGVVACGSGEGSEEAPCGELQEGSTLGPDQSIISCNGSHKLINQADGNVVVYHSIGGSGGVARWASNTVGTHRGTVTLRSGNLRLADTSGKVLFETDTEGHPGSKLLMQDDGNAVIYDAAHDAVWASGTVAGSGGGGGSSSGGCTSDSDCHDKCKRCVRSSGSCVSRLSC